MTYFSLPLSFMHPASIVMHPPRPAALSTPDAAYDEPLASYPQSIAPAERVATAPYVVTGLQGSPSMLQKMALYTRPVETVICIQAGFDTPGEIRYVLTDHSGRVAFEKTQRLPGGSGQADIGMSWLRPGAYRLMVSWNDGGEESAVMYQIEKLL